ncbi:DUF3093 domain-containing protein [Microbacterium sp. Root180]|uniref:DUF3093 domain-containing protein n=1 Tax=Microbacterium sp. Root180 TaxID=1736483 RepID=UPI0006F7C0CB|nr:DUF3093 domain-containing protein [Microbacterium sp. Root180]KRB37794.1 hypothetical protein ASD93_05535 [Microbacterium sp. Root180]
MQKTTLDVGAGEYRERLGPSLWILVSAAVAGPMATAVFAPIDTTAALVIGAVVGVAIVALLVAGSPVVAITNGELRAGRAHIDVTLLGDPIAVTGEEARTARGAGLDPRSWHVIRGGIDAVIVVPVIDPDDPTPVWVVSTRTPDRLVAAMRRAQVRRRTPRR